MFGIKWLDITHVLGGAAIALHWHLGYWSDNWQFKPLAYPALGAMTALYLVGLEYRRRAMNKRATEMFALSGLIWAATLLGLGWLPPGINDGMLEGNYSEGYGPR